MGFNIRGTILFAVAALLVPAGFAFATSAPSTAQIIVTSVVCNSGASLPQWGTGGHTIDASTAATVVADSDGNCQLQSGWSYQYAPTSATNPGDNDLTPAGDPWTTFGPSDGTGTATVNTDQVGSSFLWVREIPQAGFVPFAGNTNVDPVGGSAQIYCTTDAFKYDNYDRIFSPGAGQTYYCVSFNAPLEVAPTTATLVIVKDTNGGDGDFTFDVNPTDDSDNGSQSVDVSTDGGVGTSTDIALQPGSYNVTEEGQDGWTFDGSNCVYSDDSVGNEIENGEAIEVDAGDTVTCTFTNTAQNDSDNTSDIGVTKTIDNSTPNIGDTVTYTITASDSGADATGVVINDQLPSDITFVSTSSADTVGNYDPTSGDWTIGDLSADSSASLHIEATVNSGLENGTVITNTATVTAGDTSDDSENDSASASATVTIPSDNGGGGGGGGGNGPISGSTTGGGGNGSPTPEVSSSTSTLPIVPCSQFLTSFIRFGANNDSDQVTRLQEFLNQFEGANLTVNGIYDTPTLTALEAFQAKYASDILAPWGATAPSGYVYLTTRREVNEIYCNYEQQFPLTPAQEALIAAYKNSIGQGTSNTGNNNGNQNQGTTTVGEGNPNTGTSTQNNETNPQLSQVGAAGVAGGGLFGGITSFFSHIFHF